MLRAPSLLSDNCPLKFPHPTAKLLCCNRSDVAEQTPWVNVLCSTIMSHLAPTLLLRIPTAREVTCAKVQGPHLTSGSVEMKAVSVRRCWLSFVKWFPYAETVIRALVTTAVSTIMITTMAINTAPTCWALTVLQVLSIYMLSSYLVLSTNLEVGVVALCILKMKKLRFKPQVSCLRSHGEYAGEPGLEPCVCLTLSLCSWPLYYIAPFRSG